MALTPTDHCSARSHGLPAQTPGEGFELIDVTGEGGHRRPSSLKPPAELLCPTQGTSDLEVHPAQRHSGVCAEKALGNGPGGLGRIAEVEVSMC